MTPEQVAQLEADQEMTLAVPVKVHVVGFVGSHVWFTVNDGAVHENRFALLPGQIHPIPDPPESGGDVFGPYDRPAQMSRQALLTLLEELTELVKADDSMEGRMAYEWSNSPGEYNVHAVLRTGNSLGQGGVLMIRGQDT